MAREQQQRRTGVYYTSKSAWILCGLLAQIRNRKRKLTRRNKMFIYRIIHKFLQDFRPLQYSSRDGHAEREHFNRGIDTPSFCPTLQVLDMSTLGDAADVNPVIKFLPHTCNVWAPVRQDRKWCVSPSVDMLSFGVTIPATVPQRSEIPEGLMNYPVYYPSVSTRSSFGTVLLPL